MQRSDLTCYIFKGSLLLLSWESILRGKRRSSETCWEVISIISKEMAVVVGSIEKWSVFGYISKVDVYGLDVEYERKRGVKGNSNYFIT